MPATAADRLVVVRGEWNGWRTAMVRESDLKDAHRWQPPGAPRALVHATVRCDAIVSGDIAHECDVESAPHEMLVCLLKHDVPAKVFETLFRPADARALLHRIVHPTIAVAAPNAPVAQAVRATRVEADSARVAPRRLTAGRVSVSALVGVTVFGAVRWYLGRTSPRVASPSAG
jgi:hypothetical protein